MKYENYKIAARIVSTALSTSGRGLDLQTEMLEVVLNMVVSGKQYNWANYLADIIWTICSGCQNDGATIRYLSLIIWIAMMHLRQSGNKDFSLERPMLMQNFKSFTFGGSRLGPSIVKIWLEVWFQNLKTVFTRWRVPQNVRRSLPSSAHIQLELDHTKVWHLQGIGGAARTLKFYPSIDEIFNELNRQSNTILTIPAKARDVSVPVVEPLIDQEKEEEYEGRLYMHTFIYEAEPTVAKRPLALTLTPHEDLPDTAEHSDEQSHSDNPEYALTSDNIQ